MSARLASSVVTCADWRELPLAGNGRCLVEASAGTGKTWTIAVLYLRLLLECRHGPREIVVTTFSIAAAQELRERIRARLLEAIAFVAAFDTGVPARDDDGARWLHTRWSMMDASGRSSDRNRLALALAELDLAPIGTLHSLCRRILAEHPFDSGSTFDPGEQIDSADLDRELREDLWRRLAQSEAGALDAGDRLWSDAARDKLEQALKIVCKSGVSVRAIEVAIVDDLMRPGRAAEVRRWYDLHASTQLAKNSVWHGGLPNLATYIEAADPYAPWLEKMDALSQKLATPFLKKYADSAADDPVISFVQQAVNALRLVPVRAKALALDRYRTDLLAAREQRLHDCGQFTYDALIERALAALVGTAGVTLATRLREAWPVALVDEFQDTDAQQYAILDRIYSDGAGSQRGRLVMIGDPKQAIYGFRGGDVQAYLDASASATHKLPITVNFRSSRELVEAVNELFTLAGRELSQSAPAQIAYAPVSASGKPDRKPLTFGGSPVPRPLAFHLIRVDKGGHRDDSLRACANQIAGMLDAREHRINGAVLQPGDIAVLLPKHDDVSRLRVMLAKRGVPCVGAGKRSVFTTDIARELQIVLHGIEHAADETLVRAALATRWFGRGVDEVRVLQEQPEAWRQRQQQFLRWRQQWHGSGVLAVVQSVLAANAAHMAKDAQRERTLTDLRHLGELLQQQSDSCDGPQSLLAWFAEQRSDDGEGEAPEDRQLRIESDARRVQLMTLHASKGLQFPIVFLPLLDADKTRKPDLPLVRDARGGRVLDLGSADFDAAQTAAMFDEQDEAFRKLYVALTRAQYACHVYASTAKIAGTDPERAAFSALLSRMRDGAQGRSVVVDSAHIEWIEYDAWPWEDHAYSAEPSGPAIERRALALPARRPNEYRYSFSSLTPDYKAVFEDSVASDEAGFDDSSEAVDAIVIAEDDEPDHAELAALGAHRGENFGIALHAIFEQRDPRKPMRDQHALVRRCLVDMGFDLAPALIVAVATRVQASLDAQLSRRAQSMRLAALPSSSMLAEMGFHYVVDDVSMQRVRDACTRHGEPDLVPAYAPYTLRGLMTGTIDLIFEHEGRFHVLDYKSNYLGDRVSAYAPAALRAEMDRHYYRFQALLYTIALDRYLRQRLPGYRRVEHLGDAICLFVRAAGLAPEAGVWSHRFDDGLIADVDAVLAGTSAKIAA